MANLRQLTGQAKRPDGSVWPGVRIDLRLVSDVAVQVGEVYPVTAVRCYTDSEGYIPDGVFMVTPDVEAWRWAVKIGNNAAFGVLLEGAGGITIDELVALAEAGGTEAGSPQYEWWLGVFAGAQLADDGQVLTADGLGGADWEDGAGGMPLIDPAVAGNLAVQTAGGELVDAGFAADVNATAGSVVRRDVDGGIVAGSDTAVGAGGTFTSGLSSGVVGRSELNTGGLFLTLIGAHHAEFGTVSAIARTTGALRFLGASADANRLAQTNEVQAVSFGGAQTPTAPQQVQARANINAETAGAAATVQGNLTTHTGLTGTAVHGLGTISTQAANNVSITGGSVTGITDLSIADGGTGASTAPLALSNLGAVAKAGDTMTGTLNLPSNGLVVGTTQLVASGGNIGAGIAVPRGALHVSATAITGTMLGERTGLGSDTVFVSSRVLATKSSNMGAGFGAAFGLYIRDDAGVDNLIGVIGAARGTADDSGALVFSPVISGTVTERMRIIPDGAVGINETAPIAQLQIKASTASRIAEIIQLAASQTSDALQVQSSTTAILTRIEADGVIRAAGYKSSDGSAGWTGTFTSGGGATVTVKNGIITNVA